MFRELKVPDAFYKEAKNKGKRSRHSDLMSDLENMDIVLGSSSRKGGKPTRYWRFKYEP